MLHEGEGGYEAHEAQHDEERVADYRHVPEVDGRLRGCFSAGIINRGVIRGGERGGRLARERKRLIAPREKQKNGVVVGGGGIENSLARTMTTFHQRENKNETPVFREY